MYIPGSLCDRQHVFGPRRGDGYFEDESPATGLIDRDGGLAEPIHEAERCIVIAILRPGGIHERDRLRAVEIPQDTPHS